MRKTCLDDERGFVLATSLILLSLLTLFSVAMYFAGRSAIQTSASAQSSTMAFYYAETASNYIMWAMENGAEFDGFDFRGAPVNDSNAVNPSIFPSMTLPSYIDYPTAGDWDEVRGYLWNPGPTEISDSTVNGVAGQLMYFDNSPMGARAVSWPAAGVPGSEPQFYHISTSLPRYIRLDISEDGAITPSIPALPHSDPPEVGVDIPNNGAVVWLTAGDKTRDIEIFPLNAVPAPNTIAADCVGSTTAGDCPCDSGHSTFASSQACDANSTGEWLDNYGVVVYAIGYANGQARVMLRVVLGE